ncbi:MAG: hypothetical protein ACMXYF_05885 [Candidatus Woesearchaeota archaeon]
MRKILFFLCVFVLAFSAFGAKIEGVIYDHNLDPIQKAVVYINTTPEQMRVSQFGGYHFIVPPGSYEIWAEFTQNNITKEIARETIIIPREGEFVRDLFLFPDFDFQEEFSQTWLERHGFTLIWSTILVLALISIVSTTLVFVQRRRKNSTSFFVTGPMTHIEDEQTIANISFKSDHEPVVETTAQSALPDQAMMNKIISLLKKQQPLTQKQLRKSFTVSEAKMSLVISQMTEKGLVQKVRRGRSNVISLK